SGKPSRSLRLASGNLPPLFLEKSAEEPEGVWGVREKPRAAGGGVAPKTSLDAAPPDFVSCRRYPGRWQPRPVPFHGQGGPNMADEKTGGARGVLFGWVKAGVTSVVGLVGGA